MIRHIFIATIKDDAADEVVNQKMEEMRAMKDSVPEIESIMVARSLGWLGTAKTVTMIIDLENKTAFNALLNNETHQAVSARAGEAFDTSNFILCQIEY